MKPIYASDNEALYFIPNEIDDLLDVVVVFPNTIKVAVSLCEAEIETLIESLEIWMEKNNEQQEGYESFETFLKKEPRHDNSFNESED